MLSALPNRSEDSNNDDRKLRKFGRYSTDIPGPVSKRSGTGKDFGQSIALLKRKSLFAKTESQPGYIEAFGVLGATACALAVIVFYLTSGAILSNNYLDFPSAIMVGAIFGCMSGSLLGCVLGMAANQRSSDTEDALQSEPTATAENPGMHEGDQLAIRRAAKRQPGKMSKSSFN